MIPQAESEAGLVAYEQVLAFAALRRRKLPVIYVLFPMIFVVMAVAAGIQGMWNAAIACLAAALFSALMEGWNWKRLTQRDAANRALLADLHAKYGDNLPWLEVERQQAAIEQIKAELSAGTPPPETK